MRSAFLSGDKSAWTSKFDAKNRKENQHIKSIDAKILTKMLQKCAVVAALVGPKTQLISCVSPGTMVDTFTPW